MVIFDLFSHDLIRLLYVRPLGWRFSCFSILILHHHDLAYTSRCFVLLHLFPGIRKIPGTCSMLRVDATFLTTPKSFFLDSIEINFPNQF